MVFRLGAILVRAKKAAGEVLEVENPRVDRVSDLENIRWSC